jgi:hypothetical protein
MTNDLTKAVADLEREEAADRKAFYAGNGVVRARAMISSLAALRQRLEKLVRA